jgi:hypothetical protein
LESCVFFFFPFVGNKISSTTEEGNDKRHGPRALCAHCHRLLLRPSIKKSFPRLPGLANSSWFFTHTQHLALSLSHFCLSHFSLSSLSLSSRSLSRSLARSLAHPLFTYCLFLLSSLALPCARQGCFCLGAFDML